MAAWYMLTVVGKDRPGIVAALTSALFDAGCNLGEASMLRLGGNFTVMLMVQSESGLSELQKVVAPVAESMDLHSHLDEIQGGLHQHREPDVRISVYGADRAGIVSQVTQALAQAGMDIFDLESDVAGSDDKPVYIMHIEGHAGQGMDALQTALEPLKSQGIQLSLTAVDTIVG